MKREVRHNNGGAGEVKHEQVRGLSIVAGQAHHRGEEGTYMASAELLLGRSALLAPYRVQHHQPRATRVFLHEFTPVPGAN